MAGIHADIAGTKYEYWPSFGPLPVEIVSAAGLRAKDENLSGKVIYSTIFRMTYICSGLDVWSAIVSFSLLKGSAR